MSLPQSGPLKLENRPKHSRLRQGLVIAGIVIIAPLGGLALMGYRSAQPLPDLLAAKLNQLEQQVVERAADVASLRLMADRTRAELSELRQQKEAQEAALADLNTALAGASVIPGVNQPFYTGRQSTAEVVVSAHRHSPHTARDYLLAARRHIQGGHARDAEHALEMAETRALNDASWRSQDQRRARIVRQISDARRSFEIGDTMRTVRIIDSMAQSAH
ncbi:MAG: hypothetical protein JOZ17_11230 [Acetobacteraceae bacterium]|nr:hypothetical protein [Acetobacteraceae bacterium]